MASNFRETLILFEKLGIYDVVLPLLLVFTLVFAILEKTRVLGYETVGDKKYSRKNLNSMVAFVSAILVVGSSRLVSMINETVSNSILLLVMAFLFLLLIGSFQKQTEEGIFLEKGWKNLFMIIMFLGITLIFLNSFKMESGERLLTWLFEKAASGGGTGLSSEATSMIILFALMIGAIVFVTAGGKAGKNKEE